MKSLKTHGYRGGLQLLVGAANDSTECGRAVTIGRISDLAAVIDCLTCLRVRRAQIELRIGQVLAPLFPRQVVQQLRKAKVKK